MEPPVGGRRESARRGRRGVGQRSGQTGTEGEAFGSAKTGSERAERVRNQRIWPFKSPIQRVQRDKPMKATPASSSRQEKVLSAHHQSVSSCVGVF
ncbi:hypothetical protein OJAV_G00216370 [Oryzias javanicus]|uniref:Uncharacterized protein n=1 Tax=Oryzias javanicus TaxID=123683 RepID=A0A437C459_ORYJA|nr:hypothetical protein OJAV_G00216370 [Oryzias javanicus]